MKASVRWLRELCPSLPDDANAIAARLTAAGLEVESMHAFGLGAEACVVASIVSTRPHPSRGGLRLVTVDHGGSRSDATASRTQELVCGAPNVPDVGGLVVLAPLGTYLPAKDATIVGLSNTAVIVGNPPPLLITLAVAAHLFPEQFPDGI